MYMKLEVEEYKNLTLALGRDPSARFYALYRKLVYECFSCISHEFILIVIKKYKC